MTRFPHLSNGYLGRTHENMDLSSAFFAEFWRGTCERESVVFPQKIPRSGYFESLFSGSEDFRSFVDDLERRALSATANAVLQENLYSALLRYGRFAFVLESTREKCPAHLRQTRQIALTNASLSSGSSPDVESTLRALREEAFEESRVRRLAKITRAVVSAYRYKADGRHKSLADTYLAEALDIVGDLVAAGGFVDVTAASVAYRGLAMIGGAEAGFRSECLNQAVSLAYAANPASRAEQIVRSENIWIVNQTMSKVHTSAGRLATARSCLEEMLKVDPFNPAGHTEFGFFLLRQNQPFDALPHFLESVRLGPPGLAMNCFYAGECNRILGNRVAARRLYQESLSHDPTAVSANWAIKALSETGAL